MEVNYRQSPERRSKGNFLMYNLRKIARDSNVCIIATSQVSRSVEVKGGDKRPYLYNLKDRGSIGQEADNVYA